MKAAFIAWCEDKIASIISAIPNEASVAAAEDELMANLHSREQVGNC